MVKKTDYDTKTNEIEKKFSDCDNDKYITTQEVNKLISKHFAARLAQVNLASKNNIVTKTDLSYVCQYCYQICCLLVEYY